MHDSDGDGMADTPLVLVLKVPKKSVYGFLTGDELNVRMAELVSENDVHPLPTSRLNPEMDESSVNRMIAKMTEMARKNPWESKRLDELIADLKRLDAESKSIILEFRKLTDAGSSRARVVESISDSRIILETESGGNKFQFEIELTERGGTTEVVVVSRGNDVEAGHGQFSVTKLARDLLSFEQGYRARMNVEYLERT